MNKFIKNDNIFVIDKKDKYEVINELVKKAAILGKIKDEAEFKKALEEREALISTGIGFGFAFPHAKINSIKEFFMIVGILKNPVDWDSLDQIPVKLVFLIGGPDNQQKEYLKLLSQLMSVIKNPAKREIIMNTNNADDIVKLFD